MKKNRFFLRLTASARGETFNPLIYPSLICTLIYGLGFTVFSWVDSIKASSLYQAMHKVDPATPVVWGLCAVVTIVLGMVFLLLDRPPIGKLSGLAGFMLWVFAAFCWWLTEAQFVVFAVALPNLWFWVWQYLSLSKFNKQDVFDADHGIDRVA